MAKEKKPRERHHDEKLSINGSFDDIIRLSITPDKSIQIRKAIIEAKKNSFGFELASPSQNTSFIWFEQNVPGYSRAEIVAALIDMKDVEITDSTTGAINILKKYFE